jgi:uncharacterized tellurite resistance protein B-like protein
MLDQFTKKEESPPKPKSNIEENSSIQHSLNPCIVSLLVHTAAIDGDVDDREVREIVELIDDLRITETDIERAKSTSPIDAIEWIANADLPLPLPTKENIFYMVVKIAKADESIESSEGLILNACMKSWGIKL